MRILPLWLLVSLCAWGNVSIDEKIANTSKRLESFKSTYSELHADMAANAKEILTQNRAVLQQQQELKRLHDQIEAKKSIYEAEKEELSTLQSSQKDLQKLQNEIEEELAFAIAKNASLSLLLSDERAKNAESFITEEALKLIAKQTRNDIKSLESSYSGNHEAIKELQERINALRASIAEMDRKEHELKLSYEANQKALKELTAKTKAYETSLTKILKEQEALQSTLKRLNIVKAEEVKAEQEAKRRAKAQEEAQKEAQEASATRQSMMVESRDLPDVKQVGSSYQNVKTKPYKGAKTIAPLEGYSVTKKFGPYTDPIYNIKIFNESVSLKPKERDAKVMNILNGKVVMAQETAMLNHVVIVEHDNGIHTIYAQLDQIAPTIKTGQKIKKGSIIGRVNGELMFEVTQQNYHINPLQLIN